MLHRRGNLPVQQAALHQIPVLSTLDSPFKLFRFAVRGTANEHNENRLCFLLGTLLIFGSVRSVTNPLGNPSLTERLYSTVHCSLESAPFFQSGRFLLSFFLALL